MTEDLAHAVVEYIAEHTRWRPKVIKSQSSDTGINIVIYAPESRDILDDIKHSGYMFDNSWVFRMTLPRTEPVLTLHMSGGRDFDLQHPDSLPALAAELNMALRQMEPTAQFVMERLRK